MSTDWATLIAKADTTKTPTPVTLTAENAPSYIDHAQLKPETTPVQIDTLCEEAKRFKFKAVCVNGIYVKQAARLLEGTDIEIAACVGFPQGASASEIKAAEARLAMSEGATEIDMVLPIGLLKAGDYDGVFADIKAVRAECKYLKVIVETCLLSREEIIAACVICKQAGVDMVKTSTGFSGPGATVEVVTLMASVFGEVKASGGIRTLQQFRDMVDAGATRVGGSSFPKILEEL